MKPFKQYIKESLLDDEDELVDSIKVGAESIRFIRENYYIKPKNGKPVPIPENDIDITIENGVYTATIKSKPTDTIIFKHIHSTLTDGSFVWGELNCDFDCSVYSNAAELPGMHYKQQGLASLKGSPVKCIDYICEGTGITSLLGAPKECSVFDCGSCVNIISLKYAPEICYKLNCPWTQITDFQNGPKKCSVIDAHGCKKLKSLTGLPINMYELNIDDCDNITSFRYGPKRCKMIHVENCIKLSSTSYLPKDCMFVWLNKSGLDYKWFEDSGINVES